VTDPYRGDTIANWVGDFCDAQAIRALTPLVREYAPQVLTVFLETACAQRDVAPADIEEQDLKPALLEGVAPLEMPGSVRGGIPALCATFLEELETQGRLGGGRTLGLYVRALKRRYVATAEGRVEPLTSVAEKIGRNDPCPCGSGSKYKKCCMNRLGT
jgi:hypothetical protein